MANFLTDNGIEGFLDHEDLVFIAGRPLHRTRVEIALDGAVADFSCRGGGTRSWAMVDLSEPGSLERLLTLCRDHLCPAY